MAVLGVDLSGFHCGFAVLDENGKLTAHGLIRPDEKATYWVRQEQIVNDIDILILNEGVTKVVFEAIRQFHHGRISLPAIRDLGRLSGAIGLVAQRRGAEIVEVHTGHWRLAVLGSGKAVKEDAVDYVRRRYKIKPETDEAEAVCLAEFGMYGSRKERKRRGRRTVPRRSIRGLAGRDRQQRERGRKAAHRK